MNKPTAFDEQCLARLTQQLSVSDFKFRSVDDDDLANGVAIRRVYVSLAGTALASYIMQRDEQDEQDYADTYLVFLASDTSFETYDTGWLYYIGALELEPIYQLPRAILEEIVRQADAYCRAQRG